MNQSVSKAVAAIYERRRDQADYLRRLRQDEVYKDYPELAMLDRNIASTGAEMLFEAIDPDRPKIASERKHELTDKRKTFLLHHNIEPDFDQPVYKCTLCNDTGYSSGERCSCYRQTVMPLLIDHANLNSLKHTDFESFDPELFSDTPDEKHASKISPRQNILAIKDAVTSFADRICEEKIQSAANEKTPDNMLFLGRPGTGKSFLMACLANYLLKKGQTVFYVSAPELFEILNELRVLQNSFSPDPVKLEQINALYDSIMHAHLLLIDDLGSETRAGVKYSELLTLIDRRLAPGYHTVISSNADASSLKNTYDERLLSRLMGSYAIYRFFGDDIRLELNRRRRNRSL